MDAKLILIQFLLIGACACQRLTNLEPKTICGVGNTNIEGLSLRMEWTSYQDFPWMVAILLEEPADGEIHNTYKCGGSLIAPLVILTGAHCVQARQAKNFKVRAGNLRTNEYQDRLVVEMIVHEHYNKGSLYNDIALLFLDTPFDVASNINTICLPPPEFNLDMSHCIVKGWDLDELRKGHQRENIFKTIDLPVVPNAKCEENLRKTRLGESFELHSSFMCAGGARHEDVCKRDGGSPLICPISNQTNQYFQAGIVSWGIGCGEVNVPAVYTSIPKLRSWIDEKLALKGVNSAYFTPS